MTLAAYLAELHDAGRASSSASMAVAAACFRAKLAGQPAPAGERTARVLAGYRRTASDRGRGQARPFGLSDLACCRARHLPPAASARVRRREVSALRWADVVDSTYLHVSTPQQDASSQRLAILEYARKHDLHIDDFIEATASGQASEKRRRWTS